MVKWYFIILSHTLNQIYEKLQKKQHISMIYNAQIHVTRNKNKSHICASIIANTHAIWLHIKIFISLCKTFDHVALSMLKVNQIFLFKIHNNPVNPLSPAGNKCCRGLGTTKNRVATIVAASTHRPTGRSRVFPTSISRYSRGVSVLKIAANPT